jgi:phosphatidylinositol-3-phosphatase
MSVYRPKSGKEFKHPDRLEFLLRLHIMFSKEASSLGIIALTSLSIVAINYSSIVSKSANLVKPLASKLDTHPPANASVTSSRHQAMPRYDHIFVIIEENKAAGQIIGSPNAPNINQLAKTYGLASKFYGAVHTSEANYIAMLGGSTFGIHDDDAYYCQAGRVDEFCAHSKQSDYVNHTIASKSLMDQLQAKNLTWKGYFEDLPKPGSKAVVAPNFIRALYASKHNGFMNFKSVQSDRNLARKVVGLPQLTADLKNGTAPNYSHIVPNQCHEMHGLAECFNLNALIKTGDAMVGQLVSQITQSSLWSSAQNNAIIITFDEDNNPSDKTTLQGCCGFDPKSAANFGGGHIATIVIANHGPRGVVDATSYNHYSLLRTTEEAFGLSEHLNNAGNTATGVKSMTPLFAIQKTR